MILSLHQFLYFLPLLLRASAQSFNKTILASDPSVNLTGTWSDNPPFGSNCTEQALVNGSATFHFKGTAWYLFAGYLQTSEGDQDVLSIVDGDPTAGTPVRRTDASCGIFMFQTDLNNTDHVLNVIYTTSPGAGSVGLQSLIVTQLETEPPHTLEKPKVIGAAVGSAVGVTIIAGLAWLNAVHLKHLFEALVFALSGWLFFRARRLVFIPDDRLPHTQITFFLTNTPKIQDLDPQGQEHLIVWKVINRGGKSKSFEVICPCKDGKTTFGFGTMNDNGTIITSESHLGGSANFIGDGQWEAAEDAKDAIFAFNKSETPQGMTIGTWNEKDDSFTPFQFKRDIPSEETYKWEEPGLYLHVFSTNGYVAGCYAPDLVSMFEKDRLTDSEGIKIADLKPHSNWILESDDGRLRYRIEGSSRWNCFA